MAKYKYNVIKGSSNSDWLTGSYFDDDLIYAGDGNDYLFGHGGADRLYGQDGDDRLYGGSGNDILDGGTGADYLNGGSGSDTASYQYSSEGVTVNLLYNFARSGDAEGDSFHSIENLFGSSHDDTLWGNNADNVIKGLGGDDKIWGYDGNDTLYGGDGVDDINDGGGDDTVYGGDGDDRFYGNPGADDYFGGAGYDGINFRVSDEGVTVDLGSGVGAGGYAQGDSYDSIEKVTGSYHADTLIGDGGDNVLIGSDGEDVIVGGLGDDVLIGDAAHTHGNGYSDTFVFEDAKALEADVIQDFKAGVDKIDFTDTEFFGFNDLTNGGDRYMEQDGDDTVIHYYDHTITLQNVDASQLSADDFLFA